MRDAAAKWLNTRNRLIVRFHPETSGREAQTTQLDRAKQPDIGADKAFRAPEVKTAKLENGVEIFVVERPELPKVAVALAARAGSVADAPGKEGTAHLTVTAMDMGTKTKSALQIVDSFGDLGATLQGTAGRESAVVAFEVLKKNLAPAMNVFADVIQNPTFPAAEVERERAFISTISRRNRTTRTRSPVASAACSSSARTSLRASAHRTPCDRQGEHARRPRALPRNLLEARRHSARLRRRHHARRSDRSRAPAFRPVGRRRPPEDRDSRAATRRRRQSLPR